MPVTLDALVRHQPFGLKPIDPAQMQAHRNAAILWAHSSDLADPTPWLQEGGLLLTDGSQFLGPPAVDEWSYVERLVACGVHALGFAAGVLHDSVPVGLIEACDGLDLPLVAVPADTPFMAIIRFVGDATARDDLKRLDWLLRAQRSVSRAALRSDGLGATLVELERQLGCWVALFDPAGEQSRAATRLAMPESIEPVVRQAVRTVLRRGSRAAMTVRAGDEVATLQTVGERGRLRGVLAVGTPAPDDSARHDLVASVIGLASIALEQNSNAASAHRRLRAGVLELLLSGAHDHAAATAGQLWGRLPAEPVRVGVVATESAASAVIAELALASHRTDGRLFFAERGDELVTVTPAADTDVLAGVLGGHDAQLGLSAPATWNEAARALEEARHSLRQASGTLGIVRFEELSREGMLGLLSRSGGTALARHLLQPLESRSDRDTLVATARVWLSHNGAWDPAARELVVHRNTLRNRIQLMEQTLGIDLESFSGRAELWTALQLLGAGAAPSVRTSRT